MTCHITFTSHLHIQRQMSSDDETVSQEIVEKIAEGCYMSNEPTFYTYTYTCPKCMTSTTQVGEEQHSWLNDNMCYICAYQNDDRYSY